MSDIVQKSCAVQDVNQESISVYDSYQKDRIQARFDELIQQEEAVRETKVKMSDARIEAYFREYTDELTQRIAEEERKKSDAETKRDITLRTLECSKRDGNQSSYENEQLVSYLAECTKSANMADANIGLLKIDLAFAHVHTPHIMGKAAAAVTSAELIECLPCCKPMNVSEREADGLEFYHMTKIYTIKGIRYVNRRVVGVLAPIADYYSRNGTCTYFNDLISRNNLIGTEWFLDLNSAKKAFLSSSENKDLVRNHTEGLNMEYRRDIEHEVKGEQEHDFLESSEISQQTGAIINKIYRKLVTINRIAYLVEEEYQTCETNMESERTIRSKFMNRELSQRERYWLMKSNYVTYNPVKELLEKYDTLEKMMILSIKKFLNGN